MKQKKIEYNNAIHASNLKVGLEVLYVNEDYSILVSEYIDGKHPNSGTFKKEAEIDKLVQGLKKYIMDQVF